MILRHHFKRLRRDQRGSILVEFAMLAPVIIMAMIGVFHVAIYMQNYNSLRSVASDTSRRIMVEYQKENELSTDEVRAIARSIAVGAPYLLETDQLSIDITEEATSRVEGAKEFTVALSYTGESFMPMMDFEPFDMTYERPIFVVEEEDDEEEEDAG